MNGALCMQQYSYRQYRSNSLVHLILLQFFPDKAASRELRSVLVTCPNSGCLWRGQYEQYHPDHLAKCASAPVSCPHCGQSIAKKKVQGHKRSCPSRPLTCQHCNTQFPASNMEVSKQGWAVCSWCDLS